MKKLGKALVAIATSLAMGAVGFAGASTALAVEGKGDLTINGTVAGDVVSGYQLLGIESYAGDCPQTVSSTGAENDPVSEPAQTCKIVYTVQSKYKTAIIAAVNALKANTLIDTSTDKEIVAALTTEVTSGTIDKFAKEFMDALGSDAESDLGPMTATGASVEFSTINTGYYLIDHEGVGGNPTADNGTRTRSKYMVATLTEEGLTINLKNDTMIPEKTMTNATVNDTNATTPTDRTDIGSFAVGDTVMYEIKGTIPGHYGDFSSYAFKFVDQLSTGLTLDRASIDIKIGETTVEKDSVTISAEQGTAPSIGGTGNSLTIDFKDLKKFPAVAAGTVISATYKATVNEDATVYENNEFKISFSNDPQNPTVPVDTPTVKVTSVSFDLNVNKTNENNDPLAGASFILERLNATNATGGQTGGTWEEVDAFDLNGAAKQITFDGLSEGSYRLSEEKVPAGYQKIDPITFDVVATYADDGTVTDLKIANLNGVNTTIDVVTDPNGKPTGILNATVKNVPGTKLPSTGGMGTTILYIVGGLIVLAAAAGLTVVMRKRQN